MKKVKTLLYCTKAKPMLRIGKEPMKNQNRSRTYNTNEYKYFTQYIKEEMYEANGKIVCECDIETEELTQLGCGEPMLFTTKTLDSLEVCKRSCLKTEELSDYLYNQDKDSKGYALHISNLKIFDKPLELKDTYTRECNWNKCSKCEYGKDGNIKCYTIDIPLSRAPQNMMWVWYKGERYVLISIQSKWLCKILNGEKTIECRKRILKEMMSK